MMDLFTPIKENRDFRRIYTRGKSYVSPVVVTYVLKNRSQNVRVGITTGKKTGNAVKRNRSAGLSGKRSGRLPRRCGKGLILSWWRAAARPL